MPTSPAASPRGVNTEKEKVGGSKLDRRGVDSSAPLEMLKASLESTFVDVGDKDPSSR